MAPQSVDELVKGKYAPDKDYGGLPLKAQKTGEPDAFFWHLEQRRNGAQQ